ncbi:MAG: sodium:solute symporter family transporter [Bacillota bacterium]
MHSIDILVIIAYMLLMVAVGWWVSKKAAKNAESYFLADKSLPWWIIGIAHGSSGIDVSGTMWFVTMFFVYGVKAVWLLWIWPLFNVVFRMVYLGTWVRRSNVLTGAEWMRTRFGSNAGSELAYLSVVVYALVSVVGFLNLAFQGIGRFTQPFMPWDLPASYYAVIIMLVTGIYCVVGGMYSVILNDVIQLGLIIVAAVIIAVVAIWQTNPQQIMAAVPAGWDNLFFGWKLNLDWSQSIPQLNEKLYNAKAGDGYELFGLFIAMLFVKGILVSMAGPTPNYAIQHVLSTRSPREAALENLVMAVVSLGPRFLLVAAIAVLGIAFYGTELVGMGAKPDFEKILPAVVHNYVPVGCRGLLVAALVAAFMSTFVSTANSGVAYIVNDIYKRYMNPGAGAKKLVRLGYLWTIIVIVAGIAAGFATDSITSITKWLVSALIPAFVMPNVLKWHWWRFNGWGFFAGMVAGTAAALLKIFCPDLHETPAALLILGISFAASVLACLVTEPEKTELLMSFYKTVRPWGFWGPIQKRCQEENPGLRPNRDCYRDWFNVVVGIVWQIVYVAGPMYLVIQQYGRMWICVAVFVVTSVILKFTWYDKLGPGEMYMEDVEEAERAEAKG